MILKVDTWFERDRAHVRLFDEETDDTVIEWWDEDVAQAVEDGFLDPKDYEGSAIEYAESLGLIEEEPEDDEEFDDEDLDDEETEED